MYEYVIHVLSGAQGDGPLLDDADDTGDGVVRGPFRWLKTLK
jgi:hypothetical protein